MHEYRGEVIILKISRAPLFFPFPLGNIKILTRMFSNSSVAKQENVTLLNKTEVEIHEIKGFITAVYKYEWWLDGVYCLSR